MKIKKFIAIMCIIFILLSINIPIIYAQEKIVEELKEDIIDEIDKENTEENIINNKDDNSEIIIEEKSIEYKKLS